MDNLYQFPTTNKGILFGTSNKTTTATRVTPTGPEQMSMSEMDTHRMQYVTTTTGVAVPPYVEAKSVNSMYNSQVPTSMPYLTSYNYQYPYAIPREDQGCNVTYTYVQPTTSVPINNLVSLPEPMVISNSDETVTIPMTCPHCHYICLAQLLDDFSKTNSQECNNKKMHDDSSTSTDDLILRTTSKEHTGFWPLENAANTNRSHNNTNKELSESKESVAEILNGIVNEVINMKEEPQNKHEEKQEATKGNSLSRKPNLRSANTLNTTSTMQVHFADHLDNSIIRKEWQDPQNKTVPDSTKMSDYILSQIRALGGVDQLKELINLQPCICSHKPEQTVTTQFPTKGIQSITFYELNEYMNMWFLNLTECENVFINQVAEINKRYFEIVTNGDKIILLNAVINVDNNIITQMEAQLKLVAQSEYELEAYINSINSNIPPMFYKHDHERAQIYSMADYIYTQMRQMSNNFTELLQMIQEYTNYANQNIVGELANILNCHTNTLYCIDSKLCMMKKEIDEISQLHKCVLEEEQMIFQMTRNR